MAIDGIRENAALWILRCALVGNALLGFWMLTRALESTRVLFHI